MGKGKFNKKQYQKRYYRRNRKKLLRRVKLYSRLNRDKTLARAKIRRQTDMVFRADVINRSRKWRKRFPKKASESSSRSYTDRRRKNRDYLDGLKSKTPCRDCKKYFPAVCMDFDHLPGHIKKAALSEMVGAYSIKELDLEITKCDIVCACCHRLRTEKRTLTRTRKSEILYK